MLVSYPGFPLGIGCENESMSVICPNILKYSLWCHYYIVIKLWASGECVTYHRVVKIMTQPNEKARQLYVVGDGDI